MASSPHLPQRTPVSSPSRARWKKCCNVMTGSVTAEQAHEDGGGVAAEGVGEADTRVAHLTRARLAAELGDDLRDLRRARRTDRVPFGLEAARRVDGDGADRGDRKSTRLNSSHLVISYAVFCLKKKKKTRVPPIAN